MFSPACMRHIGPTNLQYRLFFDVGMGALMWLVAPPRFALPSCLKVCLGRILNLVYSQCFYYLYFQVNATEGDSGSVSYSLVAGDINKFAIDPVTGLVSTLQQLDREDQNRYVLTVQARDTPGSNALSSFAQVYKLSEV